MHSIPRTPATRRRAFALLLALPLSALALVLLPAIAGAQASVFTDGFESGDAFGWHSSVDTNMPNCNCYFSGDCVSGQFCNYGPGSFGTEDICNWRDNKPSGNPGTGCDIIHVGAWGGPICDGLCQPSTAGSQLGSEPAALVAQGIRLWGDAILLPSIAGGGPVDPDLAAEVLALPFHKPSSAWELGRQVADLLVLTANIGIYDHFCHYEHGGPEDPSLYVDLSNDPCRARAGMLTVEALANAYLEPGSAQELVKELPETCAGWQDLFTLRCPAGPTALDCVRDRIEDAAVFLSTPVS